jgi:hypothetical protein
MKLLNQKKCINPHFMKSGLGGREGFMWGEKVPRRWRVRPRFRGAASPRLSERRRGQALGRMTISSQRQRFDGDLGVEGRAGI